MLVLTRQVAESTYNEQEHQHTTSRLHDME